MPREAGPHPTHTRPIGPLAFLWSVAVAEGLVLGVYAALIEPARLALTHLVRIAPGIDRPRRFLVLSDAHLRPYSGRTFRRIGRAARWAAAHGATHALIAGDLLEDDREAEAVAAGLRHALGALPAVYVSGNHEAARSRVRWPYRSNDGSRIATAMAAHGIERIDERLVELDGIPVVGIGWRGWWLAASPLAEAQLVRAGGAALVLAHSPDQIVGLRPDRVLLALCGHTHGGQVRLPLIGAPWIPVRTRLPRVAGAMRLRAIPTYVSRGIGQTVPLRLGAVPEAILLEVSAGTAGRIDPATRRVTIGPSA